MPTQQQTTTLPPSPMPPLRCPECQHTVMYQHTIFTGTQPVERWDRLICAQCGLFEYRDRTRTMRRVATDH
jgi:hypothetical protein